jgi:hypothetical protein
LLETVSEGDEVGLLVVVEEWASSFDRVEEIKASHRTPEHNSLLRFLRWYLYIRDKPSVMAEDLERALRRVARGDDLQKLQWIVRLRKTMIGTGEYKPEKDNLTRDNAPWS